MDIAMRMPWTVLSELISRKSPQEDEDDRPVHNLISLKIRVAESEGVNRSENQVAEISNDKVLLPTAVPVSGVEDVEPVSATSLSILAEPHADDVGKADTTQIEFGVPTEVPVATASSARFVDERVAGGDLGSIRLMQSDEDNLLPATATAPSVIEQEAVLKPVRRPIIDVPQTRARSSDGDMAELDLEIAELRRALSSKLSVQNEQLRQMLHRFPD
jgi:hypothetical protein